MAAKRPSSAGPLGDLTLIGRDGLSEKRIPLTFRPNVCAESLLFIVVSKVSAALILGIGLMAWGPTPAAQGAECDPNYSGACVPIASDVDCAGGSGNGPAYVQGPVTVIGDDIYDLDRDGDKIGCDS